MMNTKKLVSAAVLLGASVAVHAGVVVGGSTLLNDSGLSQLENWLGEGELTLTKIFTKTSNATSSDFHAAADNKGRTFTLLSASEDNSLTWKTIGGYDPLSWNSNSSYNYSSNKADWTAFIFNLTDSVIKRQSNPYQTFNSTGYGPTFGGGHDLFVNSSLSSGYSYSFSYGNANGNMYGKSIIDGSNYNGANAKFGALEVFTIGKYTSNAVPEPTTVALLGLGLLGVAASRRKSAKSKNA